MATACKESKKSWRKPVFQVLPESLNGRRRRFSESCKMKNMQVTSCFKKPTPRTFWRERSRRITESFRSITFKITIQPLFQEKRFIRSKKNLPEEEAKSPQVSKRQKRTAADIPANTPSLSAWSAVNAGRCTADVPGQSEVKRELYGAVSAGWTTGRNTDTTPLRWMRSRFNARSSPRSIPL